MKIIRRSWTIYGILRVIRDTLLPVRPVAKQRSVCAALGEAATFDLYLLNDTDKAAAGMFTTKLGKGKVVFHRVPEMQARFLANALLWLVS